MTINRNLSILASGVSSTGVLGVPNGGSGATTLTGYLIGNGTGAFTASATIPTTALSGTITNAQLTNSAITINGTSTSLGGSISVGTVTSVASTVPAFLSISGSPITSSGTLAITYSGTALPTANGGTALTSFTTNGVLYASSSSVLTTGSALQFDGQNLGFGLTPSAWATNRPAIEEIGGAIWSFGTGNFYSLQNVYFDSGGFKYKNTAAASSYQQGSGIHYWYTASSGTTGTAVTLNEAMRISNSGGVSIGNTTDPGAGNLNVNGLINIGGTGGGNTLNLWGTNGVGLRIANTSTGNSSFISSNASDVLNIQSNNGSVNVLVSGGVSKIYAKGSNGCVGINNSSPTSQLDVVGNGNFTSYLNVGTTIQYGTTVFSVGANVNTLLTCGAYAGYGMTNTPATYPNPSAWILIEVFNTGYSIIWQRATDATYATLLQKIRGSSDNGVTWTAWI